MIEEIKFAAGQQSFDSYFNNDEPLTSIKPLSKINFFIGANNSGKSRLLRDILKGFYSYPKFNPEDALEEIGTAPTFTLKQYKRSELWDLLAKDIEELHQLENIAIPEELQKIITPENEFVTEEFVQEIYLDFYRQQKDRKRLRNTLRRATLKDEKPEYDIADKKLEEILSKIARLLPISPNITFRVNYVPIYRSLRPLLNGDHDKQAYENAKRSDFPKITAPIMANRIFWDYFTKYKKDNDPRSGRELLYEGQIQLDNIFTGETLFDKIKELRNSVESDRKRLTGFEDFLGRQFFNGQKVSIHAISPQGVDNIYVKVGDEKEYPIYDLGDGIQAIIILTFPLFYYANRTGHVLFYEEPELCLHPGMQRIFIEAILAFPNVQVFIATHSNHFLDTSVDYPDKISIFSMEKKLQKSGEPKFNLQNLSSPNMAVLNLLGVRNSSVFLANCCIWVEGISDRIYLKKFLSVYLDEHCGTGIGNYQEDIHFSFLEFGGNNIVHYCFNDQENDSEKILATRITNRIFLIHDKDSGKAERHGRLTKQLGNNYFCLDVLEIENLLAPKTIKRTLNDFKLKSVSVLNFNDVSQEDYSNIPFVEAVQKFANLEKLRKIFPNVSPGAIAKLSNKADFARQAVSHIKTWADLSPHAQQLTLAVYNYIKSHNA